MKIAELEVTSNIHGKRIVGVGGWHERKKICISVNVNFFKEKEDKILLILLLLIVIIMSLITAENILITHSPKQLNSM